MGRAAAALRWLWQEADLRAPEAVQNWLLATKERLRPVLAPRQVLFRWEGERPGGALVVLFWGGDSTAQGLKGMIFAGGSCREGRQEAGRGAALAAIQGADADLVGLELPPGMVPPALRTGSLILPPFVNQRLPLAGAWEEVERRFHSGARRAARRAESLGFQVEAASEPADLERFYHGMYLPTARNRFGDRLAAVSASSARHYFRHGRLLRLVRDGSWQAGCLLHVRGRVAYYDCIGVRGGERRLVEEGVQAAAFYHMVRWAHGSGMEALDLKGSDPYLESGTFEFKRRWGSTVHLPPWLKRRVTLQVRRASRAVAAWLEGTSFLADAAGGGIDLVLFRRDAEGEGAEPRRARRLQAIGVGGVRCLPLQSVLGSLAGDALDREGGAGEG